MDFNCQRGDIIQWVNQGGGDVFDGHLKQKVHFTIECHGVITSSVDVAQTTYVSSHWIRSCLEVYCVIHKCIFLFSVDYFVFSLWLQDHMLGNCMKHYSSTCSEMTGN